MAMDLEERVSQEKVGLCDKAKMAYVAAMGAGITALYPSTAYAGDGHGHIVEKGIWTAIPALFAYLSFRNAREHSKAGNKWHARVNYALTGLLGAAAVYNAL